jgi:hypothetical protein
MERKEGRLARLAAREEATRLKELRAAEQAELQAHRQAAWKEAKRIRAQRIADAIATKAAERAWKALQRQEQQQQPLATGKSNESLHKLSGVYQSYASQCDLQVRIGLEQTFAKNLKNQSPNFLPS